MHDPSTGISSKCFEKEASISFHLTVFWHSEVFCTFVLNLLTKNWVKEVVGLISTVYKTPDQNLSSLIYLVIGIDLGAPADKELSGKRPADNQEDQIFLRHL